MIPGTLDPVLVQVLVVGTIIAIAAVVGAMAVLRTAPEARGSPATAKQEMLSDRSGRPSMIVAAQDKTSDSLHVRFTFSDPDLTLFRIELANQLDKGPESASCVKESPKVFVATVEPEVVQRWYDANPYWDGDTKQLPIRVSLISSGQAASQTIWVTMCPHSLKTSGFSDLCDFAWVLKGPCSRVFPQMVRIPIFGRTSTKNRR
jgi:hypothetical protein